MKRRDKEIRKQPSGDPSSGENPGMLLMSTVDLSLPSVVLYYVRVVIVERHTSTWDRGLAHDRIPVSFQE